MIHALTLIGAALSANCPPEDTTATARLYSVTPGDRLTFHRTSDCRDASCSERAYVVPGDCVIVYAQANGRSCAMFSGVRATSGWVDRRRLVPDVTAEHPTPSAWIGDWYDGDDHIRLTDARAGWLRVAGRAYWPSAYSPDRPFGPHIGILDRFVRPDGDRLDYSDGEDAEYGCRATLRLFGPYLLVNDNGNCGGMNVRFCGTYRRRPAHKPATKS